LSECLAITIFKIETAAVRRKSSENEKKRLKWYSHPVHEGTDAVYLPWCFSLLSRNLSRRICQVYSNCLSINNKLPDLVTGTVG